MSELVGGECFVLCCSEGLEMDFYCGNGRVGD